MKILIITLIFLGHFLIPLKSNNTNDTYVNAYSYEEPDYLGTLYKDLGSASSELSETEYIEVKAQIFKKEVNMSSQKSFKSFSEVVYRYNVVCTSSSTFNDELTSTWLYGFWVKVNGVAITRALYPQGIDVMIYTTPTVVYYIETEEESPVFNIGWVESIYEPKIIK